MSEPQLTVYGAYWCPDCHRAKQFLGEHQIPYHWVDVDEDPEGERFVLEANDGKRRIPTLAFADGSILSNPTNAVLADELGLKTTAECDHYDLIIVGGGPAGLTAALYTAREGIHTLVIERAALGGQAATTMHLDNVPGFPDGISGAELAGRFRAQAERFGVELLQAREVTGLERRDNYLCVTTSGGEVISAHAVLLSPGSRYRRLGVPGEEDYLGAGVHYCATCDGPFYRDRAVAVIGGGNSAAEESLFLTRFADHVTLLVRGDRLKASQVIAEKVAEHPAITVRTGTEVEAFEGADSKLHTVRVHHRGSGESEALEVPAAFVFIGLDPNTAFLDATPVRRDRRGFLLTGHSLEGGESTPPAALETAMPGVFAAGDARAGSTKQVASAAGEGAAAALLVRDYLQRV